MRQNFLSLKAFLSVCLLFLLSMTQVHANQPFESFLWKSSATATAALIAYSNMMQADRMTATAGGGEEVYILRVGAQWDWNDDLMEAWGWRLSSYWELDFSKWQSTNDSSQDGANVTIDFAPMFRFSGKKAYVQPYLDLGVGVALFSVSTLEDHEFGSNFQFSSAFSVGANVGERNQWGFAYKFQHYSNGSIRVPNHGINFHMLKLSYDY